MPLDRLTKISRAAHRLYIVSNLPKKDGGTRLIEAPYKSLGEIQHSLHKKVLSQVAVHEVLHGRPNTSQLTAAQVHVRQPMVVTMDVRNFFPSVTTTMILGALKKAGFPKQTSEIITRLCTRKRRLPQGAPTSPVLSRIVVTPILHEIEKLVSSVSPHCRITQFVDDLAISGPLGIHRLIPIVHKIWERHGFTIHPQKTKVMGRSKAQEVLGVWVNNRLEPTKDFLDRLADAKEKLPPNDLHRLGLESYHRSIINSG